jgi:hypothetical protein
MPLCTFPFVLKIASCSLNVVVMASASKSGAGMASTSCKRTAVLRDGEVEFLLQSESKQSLSDLDLDTVTDLLKPRPTTGLWAHGSTCLAQLYLGSVLRNSV